MLKLQPSVIPSDDRRTSIIAVSGDIIIRPHFYKTPLPYSSIMEIGNTINQINIPQNISPLSFLQTYFYSYKTYTDLIYTRETTSSELLMTTAEVERYGCTLRIGGSIYTYYVHRDAPPVSTDWIMLNQGTLQPFGIGFARFGYLFDLDSGRWLL